MDKMNIGFYAAMLIAMGAQAVQAREIPDLYTDGRSYALNDRVVCTSVFHWYTSTGGQLIGPWRPLEGRSNWTGEPDWWRAQIKQMMAANIDCLFVHLIAPSQQQRNLFTALSQLRAQGYDVPKVAPFLDPMISWHGTTVDAATPAGKDEVVGRYKRFFNDYYAANTDPHADSYIARIDGRVVLDTWHVHLNIENHESLSRQDVESRLAAEFAELHPIFDNGIYMIGTAYSDPFLFCDERICQFELHSYYTQVLHKGIRTVQVKGGYWDQNIRTPGYCLPRDGGSHYREAWENVVADKTDPLRDDNRRVYIESWNEYDEGSGIYAGDPGAPYIEPGSDNPSTDTWSNANDPYEYIETTAEGARLYNDIADLDAKVLWHSLPTTMKPNETATAYVVVRNEGDLKWNATGGYAFGQKDEGPDTPAFVQDLIPLGSGGVDADGLGGIFRGQPVTLRIDLVAPPQGGRYTTHWAMRRDDGDWFGEELTVQIDVADIDTSATHWIIYDSPRLISGDLSGWIFGDSLNWILGDLSGWISGDVSGWSFCESSALGFLDV